MVSGGSNCPTESQIVITLCWSSRGVQALLGAYCWSPEAQALLHVPGWKPDPSDGRHASLSVSCLVGSLRLRLFQDNLQ